MARISKRDHPTILRMVDVEHRKVTEVAAEYACTPANIYALIGKLRRRTAEGQQGIALLQPNSASDAVQRLEGEISAADEDANTTRADASDPPASAAAAPDGQCQSDGVTSGCLTQDDAKILAFERANSPAEPNLPIKGPRAEATSPGPSVTSSQPANSGSVGRRASESAAIGAKLAKPGFGLMMRTADGEENLTPFRSLDDLLSAIKPILRASARSPDVVWFSLQPVDLATIDIDAA